MAKKLAFDRLLFTTVMALTGLGVAMVFSASAVVGRSAEGGANPFLARQAVAAAVGLVGLLAAMHVDYRVLQRRGVVYGLLGLAVALLLAALASPEINKAHRWVRLGDLTFQPSELAKLVLVPYLAYQIARQERRAGSSELLLPAGLVVAVLGGLVILGRDLGSALVLAAIAALMLVLAGVPWRFLGAGVLGLSPVVASSIWLEPYRAERVADFLRSFQEVSQVPYQVRQSLIAIGSGGVFGLGLGRGLQKLHFLPYPHSDFVYAIVGEELGLLGAAGVVALFGVLLWRGVVAGLGAPDLFGRHLAWGLTGALTIQALIHISVCLYLLPTTGITLPFISYGGSSLVVTMIASGVLLNVSQHGG